jgi:hypothetical protein
MTVLLSQKSNTNFKSVEIELKKDQFFKQSVVVKNRFIDKMVPGINYEVFKVDFSDLKNFTDKNVVNNVLVIKTLENIFSVRVQFHFENMMCRMDSRGYTKFQDCRKK